MMLIGNSVVASECKSNASQGERYVDPTRRKETTLFIFIQRIFQAQYAVVFPCYRYNCHVYCNKQVAHIIACCSNQGFGFIFVPPPYLSLPLAAAIFNVLPRPFLQGTAPCLFLVTPCPFQKAEMTPCLFDQKKTKFKCQSWLLALFCPFCCPHTAWIVLCLF